MKPTNKAAVVFALIISFCSLATLPGRAADQMTRYNSTSGSKLRVEGTSTLHDWRAESKLIMGFLEVGANFPTEPGKDVKPGHVDAHGEASITVRSLRSLNKDGSYYDDKMDDKMYEM